MSRGVSMGQADESSTVHIVEVEVIHVGCLAALISGEMDETAGCSDVIAWLFVFSAFFFGFDSGFGFADPPQAILTKRWREFGPKGSTTS